MRSSDTGAMNDTTSNFAYPRQGRSGTPREDNAACGGKRLSCLSVQRVSGAFDWMSLFSLRLSLPWFAAPMALGTAAPCQSRNASKLPATGSFGFSGPPPHPQASHCEMPLLVRQPGVSTAEEEKKTESPHAAPDQHPRGRAPMACVEKGKARACAEREEKV